jgi:hypothetical protein
MRTIDFSWGRATLRSGCILMLIAKIYIIDISVSMTIVSLGSLAVDMYVGLPIFYIISAISCMLKTLSVDSNTEQ